MGNEQSFPAQGNGALPPMALFVEVLGDQGTTSKEIEPTFGMLPRPDISLAKMFCSVTLDGVEVVDANFPPGPVLVRPRSVASSLQISFSSTASPSQDEHSAMSSTPASGSSALSEGKSNMRNKIQKMPLTPPKSITETPVASEESALETTTLSTFKAEVMLPFSKLLRLGAPLFTSLVLGLPLGRNATYSLQEAMTTAKNPNVPKFLVTLFKPTFPFGTEPTPDIAAALHGESEGVEACWTSGSRVSLAKQIQGIIEALQAANMTTAAMYGTAMACGSDAVGRLQQSVQLWRYEPGDETPIEIRSTARITSARTGNTLCPGEIFCVVEEQPGPDDVLYLRLADRRGWVFDQKPGVGVLCTRYVPDRASAVVDFSASTPRLDLQESPKRLTDKLVDRGAEDSDLAQLQNSKAAIEHEVAVAQSQLAALREKELQEARAENARLTDEAKTWRAKVQSLTTERAELQAQIRTARSVTTSSGAAQTEQASRRSGGAQTEQARSVTTSSGGAQTEQARSVTTSSGGAQTEQARSVTTSSGGAQTEQDESPEKSRELVEALRLKNNEHKELQNEALRLHTEVEALRKKQLTCQDKEAELTKALVVKDQEMLGLHNKLMSQARELERMRAQEAERNELQGDLRRARAKIHGLRLRDPQEAQFQNDISTTHDELEALHAKLHAQQELQEEVMLMTMEVDVLRVHARKFQLLQSEVARVQKEGEMLRNELQDLQKNDKQNWEKERELLGTREELNKLRQKEREHQETIQRVANKVKDLDGVRIKQVLRKEIEEGVNPRMGKRTMPDLQDLADSSSKSWGSGALSGLTTPKTRGVRGKADALSSANTSSNEGSPMPSQSQS